MKISPKKGQIPGSGKNHPGSGSRMLDPGGKKAPDPGSGSATMKVTTLSAFGPCFFFYTAIL
jgi:hypothetical protein